MLSLRYRANSDSQRRFQGSLSAPLSQLAWSPSTNLLAWTDTDGGLTRWQGCIPSDGVDPVKLSATLAKPLPQAAKRKGTPDLFDFDFDVAEQQEMDADPDADVDMDEDEGKKARLADMPDDDWILDDLGGGMDDEDEKEKDRKWGGGGVREMGKSLEVNARVLLTRCYSERDKGATCVPARLDAA